MPFSALSKRHQGGWHNAVSSIKACVSHKGTTRDGDKYRLNNWGTILSQQEPTWLEAIVKDSCSLFRAGWIWLFVHGENEKKASLSVSVFQSLCLCVCLSVSVSLSLLSASSLCSLSLSLSGGGGGGGEKKGACLWKVPDKAKDKIFFKVKKKKRKKEKQKKKKKKKRKKGGKKGGGGAGEGGTNASIFILV